MFYRGKTEAQRSISQGHCSPTLVLLTPPAVQRGGIAWLCDQGCGGEQREGRERERQRGEGQQPQRVRPEEGGGTLRCAWVASQAKWEVAEVGEWEQCHAESQPLSSSSRASFTGGCKCFNKH